jgi:hypothetical protein
MRRRGFLTFLAAALLSAQQRLADSAKVELRGTIERVRIVPGQGMPSIELKTADGTRRILLGSMRYLMEHNFNPKAGSKAIVKGFRLSGEIVAREIEIPSEKITLKLRAEDGTPLWRRGRHCPNR